MAKKTLSPEVRAINDLIEQFPELSMKKMWPIVQSQEISTRAVFRSIYKAIKKGKALHDIDEHYSERLEPFQPADTTMSVIDESVNIPYPNGIVRLTMDQVDDLVMRVSKDGFNETDAFIREELGFSTEEFRAIKKHLGLKKDMLPVNPLRIKESDGPEVVEQYLTKAIESFEYRDLARNARRQKDQRVRTILNTHLRKIFHREWLAEKVIENMQDKFDQIMDGTTPVSFTYTKESKYGVDDLCVYIADLHIGARTEGYDDILDTNLKAINDRLAEIRESVIDLRPKRVHIFILGDVVESFTGTMHDGTFLEMDQALFMSEGALEAVRVLRNFIASVPNVVTVHGVTGNHDRIGSKNLDQRGEIGMMIYGFLQMLLQHTPIKVTWQSPEDTFPKPDVEFNSLKTIKMVGPVAVVTAHGDDHFFKKLENVIINAVHSGKFETLPMFYVGASGHFHSENVLKDQARYTLHGVQSLFTGNYYSVKSGYDAKPGFAMSYTTRRPNGKVIFRWMSNTFLN